MSAGITMGNTSGEYIFTASLTPTSVSTITAPEQTFTVPGLKLNDFVRVTPPSDVAGVALVNARVSAANTLALKFINPTAGSVTPAAGLYLIKMSRPEGNTPKTSIQD